MTSPGETGEIDRKRGQAAGICHVELGKSVTDGVSSGDIIENGTITAFGYVPVYRRVLGALLGFCIVISLTS
jgi:hypothetical protein